MVFEKQQLAGCLPAKDADDQVELAEAAEIGRLHVGHAAHLVQQGDGRERTVGPSAQPDDAAAAQVGRRKAAEVGDDDVEDAVTVEIDDFGMGRVGDVRQHFPGRVRLVRPQQHDQTILHVASKNVERRRPRRDFPARRRQVNEIQVGDGEFLADARAGIAHLLKPDAQRVRFGRPGRRGEFFRGTLFVVTHHAIQRRNFERFSRNFKEAEAAFDFFLPVAAGETFRPRVAVARSAAKTVDLFGNVRGCGRRLGGGRFVGIGPIPVAHDRDADDDRDENAGSGGEPGPTRSGSSCIHAAPDCTECRAAGATSIQTYFLFITSK